MDDVLLKAYKVLFDEEPETGASTWEVAKEILKEWDVPKLGEDLAKECIFRIVLHVQYPNKELTEEIVGDAEDKAGELFEEIAKLGLSSYDRVHWDIIAELEHKFYSERNGENPELKIPR